MPGFRPGKVPRAMLERELGIRRDDPDADNQLYDDAKEHLFEASVSRRYASSDLDVPRSRRRNGSRSVKRAGRLIR